MKKILSLIALAAIAFTSCKKNDSPSDTYNPAVKAPLSVEFDNIAGTSDLQLSTGFYTNAAGESFKVSRLKYYVSNFVLTRTDGTVYTVPQDSCYFLIDENDATTRQPVMNVPEGEYKTLKFIVGVDSLRSTMDISKRTGVLDPRSTASDMYWDQNNGYIFFKMEGYSPVISNSGNGFLYYIGGYGGVTSATPNNIKTISLDLTSNGIAKVKTGQAPNIYVIADILKSLTGNTTMSFATTSMILTPQAGIPVALNYAAMFRHDHTVN